MSGSPTNEAIEVFLFKDSYAPFVALLQENGIDFISRTPPAGAIRNSGEVIEILKIAIPALTAIIITYLKAKQSRDVIITTGKNEVFHAKGYDDVAVAQMLTDLRNMKVIDTGDKQT